MTRDEYNAKVQELQAMWGDASRIVQWRSDDGRRLSAEFQVYWDSYWHTLGVQRDVFTPNTTYEWRGTEELTLRGQFANALMHS